MWHTDALDTFDDHLGVLSQFLDIRKQVSSDGDDLWITSMTISHWCLQNEIQSRISKMVYNNEERGREERVKKHSEQFLKDKILEKTEPVSDGMITYFPPKNVSDNRGKKSTRGWRRKDPLSTIRYLSMSLVMTGDPNGQYWTCTLVSDLIDEESVLQYTTEARQICQMFIHQQYTARALVFLLLLGYLCDSLSIECENFMDELTSIMGMDVSKPRFIVKP